MSWKTGDVVELKSGGPAMTVDVLNDNGFCECSWFAGPKRITDLFRPDTLRAATSNLPQIILMSADEMDL